MAAVNPINKLIAAKRMQQKLRKDPNDIKALLQLADMLGCIDPPDPEQKRKVLQRILSLEPSNPQARQMLFKMDRAAIGGDPSRLSAAVMLTPKPVDKFTEKPLRLIYSLLHQLLFYPVLAFSLWLLFKSVGDWDAFGVFAGFFLLLLIPLWFLSAVVEVSNSGLHLSRLFGVYRREMEWKEIEKVEPGPMGVGMKLVAADGGSLALSSQLHGYSSLVEILRNARPDLFEVTAGQTFQKGLLTRYGPVLLLLLGNLILLVTVFTGQYLAAILGILLLFGLWRFALYTPYVLILKEDKLLTKSFLKNQEFSLEQIKDIRMGTSYHYGRRYIRKRRHIEIELLNGNSFRLAGFAGGDELLYGSLKNWWSSYQTS